MGSSGGGGSVRYVQPYQTTEAEEVVTPAVARSIVGDTQSAVRNQTEQRARLRGIRSTYSRFTSNNSGGIGGMNGSASKLG